MRKTLLIWIFSLLSILCRAGGSMRQMCVRQIRLASATQTYTEKRQACDSLKQTYALLGDPLAYQSAGIDLSLYFRWMNEFAGLNRFLGNYAEAERAYNDIIAVAEGKTAYDAQCRTARQNRLSIWLRQGKYNEIIACPDSLFPDADSLRADVRLIRAEAYYNRNLQEDAAKAYALLTEEKARHATTRDVYYLKALNGLGLMLAGMDSTKLPEAYSSLSEGLAILTENGIHSLSSTEQTYYYTILSNLAYTEGRLHLFEDALCHIRQVMDWQESYYPEGDNHYITSLWKKAQILYEQSRVEPAARIAMVRTFKDYFSRERDYILRNFAFMTEHERLAFWAAQYEQLASCYLVGEDDPEWVYQVALFIKNIHIQTRLDIRELAAQKRDNRLNALIAQYEHSHDMKAEDEKLLMQILGADHLYQTFRTGMTMTPRDVSKQLRNTDVAIEWVETLVNGDSAYVALVLNKNNQVKFIPAMTKRALFCSQMAGLNFTQLISSTNGNAKEYIYNDSLLGTAFWQNIIPEIPAGSNVYFAPTGILNILAIEYLTFPKNDCRFFRLSSTGELCRKRKPSPSNTRTLLMGGINYNLYDRACSSDAVPDMRGYQVLSSEKAFGKDSPFKYLSGAASEVDSIYQILNDSARTTLVKGALATERFLKDQMPNYAIIHLSTHGYSLDYLSRRVLLSDSLMQDERMLRSGLALAGANVAAKDSSAQEDGLLTAREICELNLQDVQLVVLSACQTAVASMSEEEVASISRAFKKAGVQTLVVSLWSTGDAASSAFFTRFFSNLKKTPDAIRAAFDEAREYMMAAGEVALTSTVRTLSPGTLSGKSNRQLTRMLNLSQVAYYDSYILIDAIK